MRPRPDGGKGWCKGVFFIFLYRFSPGSIFLQSSGTGKAVRGILASRAPINRHNRYEVRERMKEKLWFLMNHEAQSKACREDDERRVDR
jgi:hypothetical protein